ncbi:MAG: M23 family metallopeptidase [Candidatus Riflebacteria bacterium]|nr:M23 family metallopeptidase [Candidatus Riflebacteria bacterium]
MRKHTVLFVILFAFLFVSISWTQASIPTHSDHLFRISDVPVAPIVSEVLTSSGQFFNTLEPRASFRGAVKTFTIKSRPLLRSPEKIRAFPTRDIEVPAADDDHKSWNGGLMMPVAGELSSPFGYRKSPFGRKVEFHSGVDLRARVGTAIHAAAPGKVVFAGWKHGYGMIIEIDHGSGFRTVYAHCSRFMVTLGTNVQAGSTIAQVGNTGSTTGPHLHFEAIRNNRLLNPLSLIRR